MSAWFLSGWTALFICLYFVYYLTRPKIKVPLLLANEIKSASQRAELFLENGRTLLEEGYAKYKNEIWGYNTQDGVKLVIPIHLLDELKNHPALTFKASIDNDMMTPFTKIGMPPQYVLRGITSGLNPLLSSYAPILNSSIKGNLPKELGYLQDWTNIKVYEPLRQVITQATARVFYGSSVVGDDKWTELSYGYLDVIFQLIPELKQHRPWLRPLIFRFSKHREIVEKTFREVRNFIVATSQKREGNSGGCLDSPPSILDILSTGKNEIHAKDLDQQTVSQLLMVAVGNATMLSTLVQAVWDLAVHPEYLPVLRDEVAQTVRDANGNFTRQSLASMQKMDSFMKESQRLTATTLSTFQRATTSNITLKNGLFIPKGTKLEIATCALDRDPQIYEDPNSFDGLRFYKSRQEKGHEHKHLFVSVAPTEIAFGYGRDACPGRFLGDMIVKMILSEIVLGYDLKTVPGKGRPASMEMETSVRLRVNSATASTQVRLTSLSVNQIRRATYL